MRLPRVLAAVVCVALALAGVVSVQHPASPAEPTVHSFLRVAPAAAIQGAGLTPDDIASAYDLVGGSSGTVAIATAYSDPHLESDLAVYRSRFGLPACGTSDGCLTIVGQAGTSSLPAANGGWGEETSLDVDAVSAACPNCRILVVEARSDTVSDLGTAVSTAAALGATAVSASWGDAEWSGWSTAAARYFTHPGVPVVAATGDDGYTTAVFPAALPNVIAVGGTTLTDTGDASGAARLQVQDVQGSSTTTATLSATVAADRKALASAKRSLAAAKHGLTTLKARLHRAEVRRAHPTSAHDALHWKHRVRDLTRATTAARSSVRAWTRKVAAAEANLLRDVLKDSSAEAAAAARVGQTDRTGWIETAWSDGGSGCSALVPRPAWQPGTTCARRGTADLAADADPQTGIATYDSYDTTADTVDGWMIAGGTSLAAPLVAGMLVRSGHAADYSSAQPLYAATSGFWDITGGSNGSCGTRLCDAGTGYDGPTGLGSPKSLASF